MKQEFINKLYSIVGREHVYTDEPMKKHTTFRIGGPADYYVIPHTTVETSEVIKACKMAEIPYYILGNGSNLLVGDKGYRGVIIQLYHNFNDIIVKENCIIAKSGASLSKIAQIAMKEELTGMEFAAGIPGTIGGAIVMNAGAYGGEMKDIVTEVTVLTESCEIAVLKKHQLEMGYRSSMVARNGYLVLETQLELKKHNQAEIAARMEELRQQRFLKQPLEYPSAGSTFKRPEGHFAGKLIMEADLRGFTVGNAQISEKHCGFVINKGHATAAQVLELMEEVSRRVNEQFGVTLEPEVKILGEF